jgi:peptidoglycan/LPS O-acetylase OafA/YrhL/lysophospholipase L1-like esterase
MPKPVRAGQRYMPGLDGLRALAVLAVIAYHEQFGWAPGGLLGVGVFFTLSGYLITDLLLGQWTAHGTLQLKDFWLRRARRLLPALFVMLALVSAYVTVLQRSQLAALRGAVAASAGYVSNWYLIAAHNSYFARFAPPAPLDHLWSLAVEEQFYLLWPWLLLTGLWCLHRWSQHHWPRHRRPRHHQSQHRQSQHRQSPGAVRWLTVPTLVLAAASALAMLAMYHPGLDPTRVYEGTDTRACGLLVGAALAMVWPSRRQASPSRLARLALDGLALAGLAVILVMIWRVGQYSPFSYQGGLVLLSVATAAVVAGVACPGTLLVGVMLGWRPLRWIGVRSYGIYLWHYPVIVLSSPASGNVSLRLAAAQITASVLLAALSWRFVEEPVRHGALGKLWARAKAAQWRARPAALAAVACSSGVLLVACAGLTGVVRAPNAQSKILASGSGAATLPPPQPPGAAFGYGKARQLPFGAPTPASAGAQILDTAHLHTSCQAVAHLGDSTSDGLISADYEPNPAKRIPARYHAVGVRTVRTDISGARSVVETLPGQINGYDAARALVRKGFRGCWVIALGTNDTADVAIGSNVGRMARVQRMMAAAHGEPVMWVDVVSLLSHGPYAEPEMRLWDLTLQRACAKYPNMRIFDWASVAKPGWFISDGIHYTSAGYAHRAQAIANALAEAFPRTGHSNGCVVGLARPPAAAPHVMAAPGQRLARGNGRRDGVGWGRSAVMG